MNQNIFQLFMYIMIFSFCACSSDNVDLHLDVDNPRNLGKEMYLIMGNGKVMGESSDKSEETITIHNYICYATILAKEKSGDYAKVDIFKVDKSGFMESVAYKEIEQINEVGFSSISTTRVRLSHDATEYVLLIRSDLEETGVRVLRVSPTIMSGVSKANPLKVPDLKTLPKIDMDPDFKKFAEIRAGFKK